MVYVNEMIVGSISVGVVIIDLGLIQYGVDGSIPHFHCEHINISNEERMQIIGIKL